MAKVVNIIGEKSNIGKTFLMEGLIKELKFRGLSLATIKHDVHDFDIDKEGKDTYKHRKAGSEKVIISSKKRMAIIEELKEEYKLIDLIYLCLDKDVILIEGYKNSNLRKIEVFDLSKSSKIISKKENLIAIAANEIFDYEKIEVVERTNFKRLCDLIEKEEEFKIE